MTTPYTPPAGDPAFGGPTPPDPALPDPTLADPSASGNGSQASDPTQDDGSSDPSTASDDSTDSTDTKSSYATMTSIPADINSNVTFADQATMLSVFGTPGALTKDCSDLSNAKLQAMMTTANVGPFKTTGLKPVIDLLTRVFAAVQTQKPDLYAVLTTEGTLCCRAVRGSTTQYSNHSWGTAIDISISHVLTARGATSIQQGLVDLAPFMNAENMFWGAGFAPTVDAMHFEASHELILAWQADGTIPSP